MNPKLVKLLKITTSLILLISIIYIIKPSEIIKGFSVLDLRYMPIILLFFALNIFFGGLNIFYLLRGLSREISFWKIINHSLTSWAIGLFSPGRVGEFSFVYFIKKEGFKSTEGISIVILDKAITFLVLLVIAVLASFKFLNLKSSLIFIALFIIFIGTFLLMISKKGFSFLFELILKKYKGHYEEIKYILNTYLKNRKKLIFLNFIITLLKWLFIAIAMYLLFKSFNTTVDFLNVIAINSLIIIASFVPISLSGIGVREGLAIYLYGLLNVSKTASLNVHLVIDAISYSLAIFMLIFYLLKREKRVIEG